MAAGFLCLSQPCCFCYLPAINCLAASLCFSEYYPLCSDNIILSVNIRELISDISESI